MVQFLNGFYTGILMQFGPLIIFSIRACDTFFSAMLDAFRLLVSLCILLTDGGSFQISGPASGEIDMRCFDANFVAFVWTHRVHRSSCEICFGLSRSLIGHFGVLLERRKMAVSASKNISKIF